MSRFDPPDESTQTQAVTALRAALQQNREDGETLALKQQLAHHISVLSGLADTIAALDGELKKQLYEIRAELSELNDQIDRQARWLETRDTAVRGRFDTLRVSQETHTDQLQRELQESQPARIINPLLAKLNQIPPGLQEGAARIETSARQIQEHLEPLKAFPTWIASLQQRFRTQDVALIDLAKRLDQLTEKVSSSPTRLSEPALNPSAAGHRGRKDYRGG